VYVRALSVLSACVEYAEYVELRRPGGCFECVVRVL